MKNNHYDFMLKIQKVMCIINNFFKLTSLIDEAYELSKRK
jgi:hypothetical protein